MAGDNSKSLLGRKLITSPYIPKDMLVLAREPQEFRGIDIGWDQPSASGDYGSVVVTQKLGDSWKTISTTAVDSKTQELTAAKLKEHMVELVQRTMLNQHQLGERTTLDAIMRQHGPVRGLEVIVKTFLMTTFASHEFVVNCFRDQVRDHLTIVVDMDGWPLDREIVVSVKTARDPHTYKTLMEDLKNLVESEL